MSLLERTALNTIIERVIATDQDTGSNAELEYAFISGNIEGKLVSLVNLQ